MGTLMGWPTADKADLWVRQTDRRISMLERRPTGGGDVHDAADITTGQLSPFRLPGPAPFIRPTLGNGWVNFSAHHHKAGYLKTSAGIVVLSGVIAGGTTTDGTLLFTLPVGYRPDSTAIFMVLSGNAVARVTIFANGQVVLGAGITAVYVSLDGIMFPAADAARVWTPITSFVNNYADYSGPNPTFPPVSYWVDTHGRVWWRGLVYRTSGGTPAADTTAFTIPAAARPARGVHIPALAFNTFGYGIAATDFFVGQNTNFNWMSMSQFMWIAASAVPYPSGYNKLPVPRNSWTNLDGADTSWVQASYVAFPDGLVVVGGLLVSGATGVDMGMLAPGFLPDTDQYKPFQSGGMGLGGVMIFPTVASFAIGRFDLRQTADGGGNSLIESHAQMVPVLGTTSTWYSINGVNYVIAA